MTGAVGRYARSGPITTGYLSLLLATHIWLDQQTDPGRVTAAISTNLDNLGQRPVQSLFGSLLFFDGSVTRIFSRGFGGTVITVGIGIGIALWWLEKHRGPVRAVGVFLAGHIGATLITAIVIHWAIGAGRYPAALRSTSDFGVSYGAQATLAALTPALPRRWRLIWIVFVVGWPLSGADWSGWLPDFTTIGHLLGAAIGFGLGPLIGARTKSDPSS